MLTPLPLSMRFALWFSAWGEGRTSLDEARDAIVAEDAAHDVAGLPGADDTQPLIVALGRLRAAGATGAGIALPVPGDLLGLAGPPSFNMEVVEAGEGVLVEGAGLGLVPHRAGAGVVWVCHPATCRRQVPDSSEAEQALRRELLQAERSLADLDVARWRPEVADALMGMRRHRSLSDYAFPGSMPPGAVRLAALATRCRTIVELALEDDGGAVTAAEADARREALAPLDAAARRALVATCSPSLWP